MTAVQMSIIVFFSAFTGWIISWLTIRLLFSSSIRSGLGTKAGQVFQQEFESSKMIDEKMTDPSLFEKMKPEIEKHVDFFLNEKLAAVFPLLYKFMGEKTLRQFKDAFMIETDLLFPLIIKNYMTSLKKEIRLDTIISTHINAIPIQTIRLHFFKHAKKEIFFFRLVCCITGLIMGMLAVVALHFIQ
ncbi:MAG: hypothetical protein ABI402_18915 [Ferruginibacter sp.]